MGICSSSSAPNRIIMVGLDSAGKTTLLYKLKCGEVTTVIPTIGFNVESLSLSRRTELVSWDIGGRSPMRPLWRYYCAGAQGLVFVVDSADRERLEQAAEELARFLEQDDLRYCPLLVLANKKDLPNAMPLAELSEALRLQQLKRTRPLAAFAICASTFEGAIGAFEWLAREVKSGGSKEAGAASDSGTSSSNSSSKIQQLAESLLPKGLQKLLFS